LPKTKAIKLVQRLEVATPKDFAEIGVTRHYLCKLCAASFFGLARLDTPRLLTQPRQSAKDRFSAHGCNCGGMTTAVSGPRFAGFC
jgi:hypothetical protein